MDFFVISEEHLVGNCLLDLQIFPFLDEEFNKFYFLEILDFGQVVKNLTVLVYRLIF